MNEFNYIQYKLSVDNKIWLQILMSIWYVSSFIQHIIKCGSYWKLIPEYCLNVVNDLSLAHIYWLLQPFMYQGYDSIVLLEKKTFANRIYIYVIFLKVYLYVWFLFSLNFGFCGKCKVVVKKYRTFFCYKWHRMCWVISLAYYPFYNIQERVSFYRQIIEILFKCKDG